MSAELAQLSTAESALLAECEATIRSGLQTFVAVGRSLAQIRDGGLYRQTHTTFENYCQQEYSLSRSRAYQMIDAAGITEALSTNGGHAPTSERQARELADLEPEIAAEVMQEAADSGEKITAKVIEEARRRIAPKPVEDGAQQLADELAANDDQYAAQAAEVATPVEPAPAAPEPEAPATDPFADDEHMRRLTFQSALAKQITAARKGVLAFNVADVAELADNDQVAALDELLRSLGNFVGSVRKQRIRLVRSAR